MSPRRRVPIPQSQDLQAADQSAEQDGGSASPRARRRGAAPARPEGDAAGHDSPPHDAPSFAAALCRKHRRWVVDRTARDGLPAGWRMLLSLVFDDLAFVIPRGRRFALHRLEAQDGALAVTLVPDRARAGRDDTCLRSVELVLARARDASLLTCEACGEPGWLRPVGSTLCDAHAPERPGPSGPSRPLTRPTPRVAPSESAGLRATPRAAERIPIYDLRDVGAALGLRVGEPDHDDFRGDPEDGRAADADTALSACLRRIHRAGEGARWRDLARPDAARLAALDELSRRAPHLREAVALVSRHLGAAIAMGTHTAFPPLLLVGEPGTGKTWFAERLAHLLGVPVRRHPMNVATLGDGLTGSHPVWRAARAGLVARTLLSEQVANPVIVVDEVDKAASHNGEDPYRPLYTCLEPASAKRFTDEYLGFPLDASHVSWVLTANSVEPLPAPIIDRVAILEVPPMDDAHLRAVAASAFDEANAERRLYFDPPAADVVDRLVAASPRRMRSLLVEAMARAAAAGRRALRADDVVAEPRATRRRAGFGAWS